PSRYAHPRHSPSFPTRPSSDLEPDVQVAVAMLQQDTALFVESEGRLVAAVELVSPRNKDRPLARTTYLTRYLGYLLRGVNLLLVDRKSTRLNSSHQIISYAVFC